jgi:adenylate cyclase, class 2
MGTEIEKKFRLTSEQRDSVLEKLKSSNAEFLHDEFEENVLYNNGTLHTQGSILRLRTTDRRSTLTFKSRLDNVGSAKCRLEEETIVSDPRAMDAILKALGFKPTLVYEKRRSTWKLADCEVVMDELPFGLFMEIEGDEPSIAETERMLETGILEEEHRSYPQLTFESGDKREGRIEARFE